MYFRKHGILPDHPWCSISSRGIIVFPKLPSIKYTYKLLKLDQGSLSEGLSKCSDNKDIPETYKRKFNIIQIYTKEVV